MSYDAAFRFIWANVSFFLVCVILFFLIISINININGFLHSQYTDARNVSRFSTFFRLWFTWKTVHVSHLIKTKNLIGWRFQKNDQFIVILEYIEMVIFMKWVRYQMPLTLKHVTLQKHKHTHTYISKYRIKINQSEINYSDLLFKKNGLVWARCWINHLSQTFVE